MVYSRVRSHLDESRTGMATESGATHVFSFLPRWLAIGAASLAGIPAAQASEAAGFFAARPEYAVLPPAYFDPAIAEASDFEAHLDAGAFLPPGTPWRAELEVGRTIRVPATGYATQRVWEGHFPLGTAPVPRARMRLFALERGVEREVVTVGLGTVRPTRFQSRYERGPFARQRSRDWGEQGLWLVLIQRRHAPSFSRLSAPVLYVGGDFGLGRIDRVVRYLRTHGYNVYGYNPAYGRRAESLAEIGQHDLPEVRAFLSTIAPGQRAHLVGICVGGLVARSMAATDAALPGRRAIASVTGIGTPNGGVELADLYNGIPHLSTAVSWALSQPERQSFKDTAGALAGFGEQVRDPADVPRRMVVLDAGDMRVDDAYAQSGPLLQLVVGLQRGQAPWTVRTDGLVTIESQSMDGRFDTWRCDHSGMLNKGRTAETFDAYAAHRALLDSIEAFQRDPTTRELPARGDGAPEPPSL